MKTFAKNLIPDLHLHISPIGRDIFMIAVFGFMVAVAVLTMVVMMVSRF